jgi:hypothetical protein
MEADRVGCGEHALGSRLTHAMPGVEHAIDGRDAHMRRARDRLWWGGGPAADLAA